jgi:hypothetical protein
MITVTEQGFALREKAMLVPNSIACKAQLELEDALTLKRICEQLTNNLMD